jgi:anaerobic dimethyl sulfoxide reductase subunit B (iron-sulfur subunit)
MTQYAFYFDGTRCTGCKTCQFACKDYRDLSADFNFRKVYEVTGGQTTRDDAGCVVTTCFSYAVSSSCQHCDNPACVAACPTGAMHKDEETGLVSPDVEVCIGCGACATVCPYGAPAVDADAGHSVKCDGCAERVAAGMKPVCVQACPARALDFGPVEEISQMGDRAAIAPFCDPDTTNPNLYIKPSVDARPFGDEDCTIANPLEA